MKNMTVLSLLYLLAVLFLFSFTLSGQKISGPSATLPAGINAIVTKSCMPCHSNSGSLRPRFKLNFNKWDNYSAKKQKEKAEKMYSELQKEAMPPKSERKSHPEKIPTAKQLEAIKMWVDSLK